MTASAKIWSSGTACDRDGMRPARPKLAPAAGAWVRISADDPVPLPLTAMRGCLPPSLKLVNACDHHGQLPHPMNGARARDLPRRGLGREHARRKADTVRRVVSDMTGHLSGVRGLLVHNERSMAERLRRRRWQLV